MAFQPILAFSPILVSTIVKVVVFIIISDFIIVSDLLKREMYIAVALERVCVHTVTQKCTEHFLARVHTKCLMVCICPVASFVISQQIPCQKYEIFPGVPVAYGLLFQKHKP